MVDKAVMGIVDGVWMPKSKLEAIFPMMFSALEVATLG